MYSGKFLGLRLLPGMLLLLALLVPGMLLNACGSEEERTAASEEEWVEAPAPEAPTEAQAVPAPAAQPKAALAQDFSGPAAQERALLSLKPQSAHIALVGPAINALLDKAVPLAKRLAPPNVDVQTEIDEWSMDLADGLGVEEAWKLPDVARAKGVDPDQPFAVFLDFSAQLRQGARQLADAPEAGEDAEASAQENDAANAAGDAEARLLWVVPITSRDAAEATIAQLVSEDDDLSEMAPEQKTLSGVDVTIYDPDSFSYFYHGGYIVFGDSLTLLEEAAQRTQEPFDVASALAEVKLGADTMAVMLTDLGQYITTAREARQEVPDASPAADMIDLQIKTLEDLTCGEIAYSVGLLNWNESLVELMWRMEAGECEGVRAWVNEMAPLELATALPADTLAFAALRFGAIARKQLLSSVEPLMALQDDPSSASSMAMGAQAIDLVGDEIALGIGPIAYDFPSIYLMVKLVEPESMKGLMQLMVPMEQQETYKDVVLNLVTTPTPVPVYVAFVKDTVVAASQLGALKTAVDNLQSGTPTGMLTGLKPPFDPARPTMMALALDTQLLTEVVVPTMELMGALPEDGEATADRIASAVSSLRLFSGIEDDAFLTRIALHLKAQGGAPEPAAAAAEGAGD